MEPASEETIVRYARVLTTLGLRNGLTNLRRAGDGHVLADITPGRTYFDVAGFELEAESLIGESVDVILSGTSAGDATDRGPLTADQVA